MNCLLIFLIAFIHLMSDVIFNCAPAFNFLFTCIYKAYYLELFDTNASPNPAIVIVQKHTQILLPF